jgi:hypothetical protein
MLANLAASASYAQQAWRGEHGGSNLFSRTDPTMPSVHYNSSMHAGVASLAAAATHAAAAPNRGQNDTAVSMHAGVANLAAAATHAAAAPHRGQNDTAVSRTYPRKKKGEDRRSSDKPVRLTRENVVDLFTMSLKDAAASVGMCPTSLKKACRKLGVLRWPFRAGPRPACAAPRSDSPEQEPTGASSSANEVKNIVHQSAVFVPPRDSTPAKDWAALRALGESTAFQDWAAYHACPASAVFLGQ